MSPMDQAIAALIRLGYDARYGHGTNKNRAWVRGSTSRNAVKRGIPAGVRHFIRVRSGGAGIFILESL